MELNVPLSTSNVFRIGSLTKQFTSVAIIERFPAIGWYILPGGISRAYLIMHNWLEGYKYRIAIHWRIFAAAGATAVFIALVTISFQAIKAALANPVRGVRSE